MQQETREPTPPSAQSFSRWASFREIGRLVQLQWPKYMVDIIVIILGITISFALDSYKEEAGRKTTEQLYLKSLLADVNSDIEELTNVINLTKKVIANAQGVLALTDQPEKVRTNAGELLVDLKGSMDRPNFISKDATFSDLRSSGNMQFIRDIGLKNGLFEYYRLYESLKAVETSEREVANTIIADYLLKHFSIKGMTSSKGPVVREGVEMTTVLRDTEFSNVVSLRLINRVELVNDYQNTLALAEKIKARLEVLIN